MNISSIKSRVPAMGSTMHAGSLHGATCACAECMGAGARQVHCGVAIAWAMAGGARGGMGAGVEAQGAPAAIPVHMGAFQQWHMHMDCRSTAAGVPLASSWAARLVD